MHIMRYRKEQTVSLITIYRVDNFTSSFIDDDKSGFKEMLESGGIDHPESLRINQFQSYKNNQSG